MIDEGAAIELNLLQSAPTTERPYLGDIVLEGGGTPIYDENGSHFVTRHGTIRGNYRLGYADVAAREELGCRVVAISRGLPWNAEQALALAREAAAQAGTDVRGAEVWVVAFSYPRVGFSFRRGDEEVVLIEWPTGRVVPTPASNEFAEPIAAQRWSFLDRIPPARKELNAQRYLRFGATWERVETVAARCLMFSLKGGEHECFGLRTQMTDFWCVPATVEMVLDFFRYEHAQQSVAEALGLGRVSYPLGMTCSREEFRVVRAIEGLSRGALSVTMNACGYSFWDDARTMIDANRPLILFSRGHARVVTGYSYHRDPTEPQVWLRKLILQNPLGSVDYEDYDANAHAYARCFTLEHRAAE